VQTKTQGFMSHLARQRNGRQSGRYLSIVLALMLLLGSVQLTSAAPTGSAVYQATNNNCTTNVAEAAKYTLVYRLDINVNSNYGNGQVPYAVDNSATIGGYSRVAYCLELDGQWLWVSMDDFTNDVVAHTGVPVVSLNPNGFQQTVANMNVYSNRANIVQGYRIPTGNIEFWANCYDPPSQPPVPGASDTAYDFGDTRRPLDASCPGYGSMQVHNYGARQTVLAYNAWNNAAVDETGIGNHGSAHTDWTFSQSASVYTTRRLWVYVAQDVITTVAGNGSAGFSGDGRPATSAGLRNPYAVGVDGAGNVFIADSDNQRIRKVSANGVITTVAGNGAAGFSGDGGPATSASMSLPYSVKVNSAGDLFFVDQGNQRIRKVDANGTITTVAGDGAQGFSGDGGPATSAKLNTPVDVAVDGAGNLFIADYNNGRIRKVDTNDIITTVAGNGGRGFSGDGGPATSASLNLPYGVAVDGAGNLFIADSSNHRLRKVDTNGIITTVAGNGTAGFSGDGGPATSAKLNEPDSIVVDGAGNLFFVDYSNQRIRKVGANGVITTVAGNGTAAFSGDGGPATSASLRNAEGVAVDSAGNLFIADQANSRIRRVGPLPAPPLMLYLPLLTR